MSGTLTLEGFLLARIAEDEAKAYTLDLIRGQGHPVYVEDSEADRCGAYLYPEKLRAEAAAKRRIVELHRREWTALAPSERAEEALEAVLRYLAQPYSDHPSFDASWGLQ